MTWPTRRCEFCNCTPDEPCIDYRTGWKCSFLDGALCSACVDETIAGFEPTAIELAHVITPRAVYL